MLAFCLSGKVVALHLVNSTAEVYLCNHNQGGRVSLSLFRLVCCILNLADEDGITLIPGTYLLISMV